MLKFSYVKLYNTKKNEILEKRSGLIFYLFFRRPIFILNDFALINPDKANNFFFDVAARYHLVLVSRVSCLGSLTATVPLHHFDVAV